MLPRALVLSADEKVSGLLQQALATAGCEVRTCKEIFSAIEEVTRESFQLLLIDWHDELEANFLFQTARDLKCNRTAFAVAIGTPAQGREALQSGADAILVKPFTVQQAEELLLPRLGVEWQPKELPGQQSPPQSNPQNEPARQAEPARTGLQALMEQEPSQRIRTREQPLNIARLEAPSYLGRMPMPSNQRPRFFRMLSLAAVVWPVIIAAALLAFDQWPHLPSHGLARLSGIAAATEVRIGTLPRMREQSSSSSASNEGPANQAGPAMPITDDLLADYASPVMPLPLSSGESVVPKKLAEIDLDAVSALPSSTRLIAPVVFIAHSGASPVIPNSLRFPPPAQNAIAVIPKGDLIAPEWPETPVALPETVSRALLERQVAPQYPEQAWRAGVDGTVVLQASIARDGTIRDLKLVSGYLVLARAAFDAVRQWRYKPYRRNGESVEVETLITVNFKRRPRG
jgi:TonB family protein